MTRSLRWLISRQAIPSPGRLASAFLPGSILAGVLVACWNDLPTEVSRPESREIVLSDTSETSEASSTAMRSQSQRGRYHAIGSERVTYVSLPSGAVSNGMLAIIRNRRTGDTTATGMTGGGFDPVTIRALPGDTLATTVLMSGGGSPVLMTSVVPPTRRPRVVRTIPPRGKTAVPLNARVTIVFSEPMDPQSISAASIRLMSGGNAIPGQVRISDTKGIVAEFIPNALLAADAQHRIVVTPNARDLDGDVLEGDVNVEFTTGNTVVLASVTTDEIALFTTPGGEVRTFDVNAVQYGDQSFSGRFTIFYPGPGRRSAGRITCFKIGIGRSVWLAGVLDDAANPDLIGTEWGWRLADNGPRGGVTPDMLSLAHPLDVNGFGTAQSFCETMPVFDPVLSEDIALIAIEAGDIAVRYGDEQPPPPVDNNMSRIAFAASPNGGIRVMRADGYDVRPLTSGQDWNPSWSPDGKKIAFDRRNPADGNRDIYVMNSDGSGLKRLTSEQSIDADPEWSPDGKKLAFYRDGAIHVMNASDGTDVIRLTDDGAHPTWSPDGSRIAFWSGRSGKWGVYVMNANGSGLVRLTSDTMNASNPSWSPDGRSIVFSGDNAIYIIDANGNNLRRVAVGGQTPAWSHDSRMIIYEWYGLRVINADGSGMTTRGFGFDPAWSPQGTVPSLPPASLTMQLAGGNNQVDTVLATLPQPLSVRLVRDDGSPAPGIRVYWQVLLHDGTPKTASLASRSTVSDATGIASVGLTLGSIADVSRIHAFVTDGSARNAGVEFTVTATAGHPKALLRHIRFDDVNQIDSLTTIGSRRVYALSAVDGHGSCPELECGNRIVGLPISWSITPGGGALDPALDTTETDADEGEVLSHTVHTVGSAEGAVVVTASVPSFPGLPPLAFATNVVTSMVVYTGVFDPGRVDVPSGRTVGWIWDDDFQHNVTFEDDPTEPTSSPTRSSAVFRRTFTGAARSIRYRCTLHSSGFTGGEVGVVIVTAP